jgi:hypothetical protein
MWRCFEGPQHHPRVTSQVLRQVQCTQAASTSESAPPASPMALPLLQPGAQPPPPTAYDQVRIPLPTSPHLHHPAPHKRPHVPEVVRIQRQLLSEEAEVNLDDLEMWNFTHVVREFIDPESKMKMLRLRFSDDVEEDICARLFTDPSANDLKDPGNPRKGRDNIPFHAAPLMPAAPIRSPLRPLLSLATPPPPKTPVPALRMMNTTRLTPM